MTKRYYELRQAYKQLLEDNQKLMADNRDLRNQIEGAKVLIYQQKNLVRCRDCKYKTVTKDGEWNPEDIVCGYWMSDGLEETDFCSYGEKKDDQV